MEEDDDLLEEQKALNLETNKSPSTLASFMISDTPSTRFQSNALETDLQLTSSLDFI